MKRIQFLIWWQPNNDVKNTHSKYRLKLPGVMMMGMVILFLVVVLNLQINIGNLFKGFLPIAMPPGSANIVLSLIGTTSLGFNLFLGGEMARGDLFLT